MTAAHGRRQAGRAQRKKGGVAQGGQGQRTVDDLVADLLAGLQPHGQRVGEGLPEDLRAVCVAERVRVEGLRPVLVEVADADADDPDPEGGGVVVAERLSRLAIGG